MSLTKKEVMLARMVIAESERRGFTVQIKSDDLPKLETITNPAGNISVKRAYYASAYNDELQLIANPSISIVNYQTTLK